MIWEGNNKGNIAYIEISVNSLLAKNEGFYTAEFDVERYFLNLKAERKYTAEELGLI